LSHIQRGGNPTVRDRVFASLMGAKAVDLLLEGQAGIFLGLKNEQLATFDIVETLTKEKHQVRRDLYQLNQGLSAK
jgi:6-phosphofructokinase